MFQKFGRYEIIEPIGNGSFGMVYRANDPNLDRVVAIKVINQLVSDPQVLADIRNEARLTANLDHPNIVRIYDFEVDNNMAYIVMPFLPDCLANHIDMANPSPYERTVEMATQIARGLGHAHSQKVVHRDIKPSNILMTSEGNLQVADFGIARTSYRMERTYGAGTLLYMAPELWTDDTGDHRVDIYSFGVTLFEMLTGYRPFQGPSQRDLLLQHTESSVPPMPTQLGVPKAVEDVVRKAMAKNPDDRFPDADLMADALASALTSARGSVSRSTEPGRALEYLRSGNSYHDLGQYQRAIEDYDKAIELDPNYARAYNNRGDSYRLLRQYQRAIEDYDKAIELNPNYARAYNSRGNSYRRLRQYQRAIEDYDKAIELDPTANRYSNRGLSYRRLGQYQRSIEDYDKAIELDPNDALAYNNRGLSYRDLGQNQRAIEDYDKAIELDPNYARAYNNRGLSYRRLGQYQRSIEDFDNAIELDPDFTLAYNNRGDSYRNLGQYQLAIEDYDKAIDLDPNLAAARAGRQTALRALG